MKTNFLLKSLNDVPLKVYLTVTLIIIFYTEKQASEKSEIIESPKKV